MPPSNEDERSSDMLLPGNERRHRARLPRHDELNLLGGPKGVPLLLMGVVN